MIIPIKKLTDTAILPTQGFMGDAGYDLYADENVMIPGTVTYLYDKFTGINNIRVKTGLAVAIPDGYVGLIWDKSGIATKHNVHVLGGVIDATYRGEIEVCLVNFNKTGYITKKGDKIAQLLIQPVLSCAFQETNNLNNTQRGEGGFGSTGI